MKKIKIFFIGGLANGKIVLESLLRNKNFEILGVITHKITYKGPENINLQKFYPKLNYIHGNKVKENNEFLKSLNIDYIFVCGWSHILDYKTLQIPKRGVIGFHPSKLPMDRGRSTLAWQIEEGYKSSGLSVFF